MTEKLDIGVVGGSFIRHPPDFATIQPADADAGAWWTRAVQHPDGFTFEAAAG